jgi:hypothetical protein
MAVDARFTRQLPKIEVHDVLYSFAYRNPVLRPA